MDLNNNLAIEKENIKPEGTNEKVSFENRYEDIVEFDTPAYRPRKKSFGDRSDGRLVKTLPAMSYVSPFIMSVREDAQNFFEDVIDITNIEHYLDKKHQEGYTDMTLLHVILAAYVRVVSERPSINRFLAGQRIYAAKRVDCVMVVKKAMTLEGDGTAIKVTFDPRDNIYNVYKKFQRTLREALDVEENGFDNAAKIFNKIPRPILRGVVKILNSLDYVGLLPKALIKVSPFHGSMIITSMGSLGIPAIYHHLYHFGTLPIFMSYGSIFTGDAIKRDGTRERHHFVTFKVVTDERICDGYNYASAFKRIKRYLLRPELLDNFAESAKEDID
jgi:hypothetical protein